MYEIKNGILYKSGVPVIGLGQSYYPSYHTQKVPVPEDGDRYGEMVKDMKAMAEAGFNVCRTAALGNYGYDENETVVYNFDFIDSMLEEISKQGMASMIRLQGYSINMKGYPDAKMIDQNGNPMPFRWFWFVQCCVHHPGILQDSERLTLAEAEHFSKYPDLVGFQIYNEAGFPNENYYDYNPYSIQAYRKWLVEKGIKTPAEAEHYEPPKRRPHYDEDPEDWVNFRLFTVESLNRFLNHLAEVSTQNTTGIETFTCDTPDFINRGNCLRGMDYFAIAQRMDLMGITHYIRNYKADFFNASLALDCAESAAATFGKHAWLIEYNAHVTGCSGREWERETYTALASAFKGIVYYQWRADYPFPDSPEPNGFGMIYNDGTKTEKYDMAIQMTAVVNRLGPWLATSEKLRSQVGILYSNHANAYFDAIDNGDAISLGQCAERQYQMFRRVYRAVKEQGINADIQRTCDLADNPLNLQILLVPSCQGLSQKELQELEAFAATHLVFEMNQENGGYQLLPASAECGKIWEILPGNSYRLEALFSVLSIVPPVRIISRGDSIAAGTLISTDGYTACLTNFDDFERNVTGAIALLREDIDAQKAYWITPQHEEELVIEEDRTIRLPEITTGGFIVLHRGTFEQ